MKKLFIILLAVLCIFMVSCNRKDNGKNPVTSVDKTEPNTSSPETTASPETSSPETTESPETTKPPVPATTIPEQAGDPVLLPITYGEVTDFKYHTYSFPHPIHCLMGKSYRFIFKSRSELVNFIESKEYLEKLDLKYWWGTQEPIADAEKEKYKQQVTDAVLKLLDMYDEKFFEDTWIILTCNNADWFEIIDQVIDVYRNKDYLGIAYTMSFTIPKEEIRWDMIHRTHLVSGVFEIPKEYLLDEPEVRAGELYPWESINTIKEYGVDSKEAAELAKDERVVKILKEYREYRMYQSESNANDERVKIIDAFLEKYQK